MSQIKLIQRYCLGFNMNYKRVYEDDYLENQIRNIVSEDIDYSEFIRKNNYFEYHYFLSYLRHDLLKWYPFKKEGSLLEIGSSYGQLTSLFTQKVNHVVAVEDTESKCEIISKRDKNAKVILSEFDNINVDEKFDYIILCNIFEYAKAFHKSKNPYSDYLQYLKTFLKEDGVILLALSNRLGLKYFAGFREEHTNQFFSGIEGYNNLNYIETFSRTELENIIKSAGFENYKFFYPFPDHVFPQIIASDSMVNKLPFTRQTKYFIDRTVCFDEGKLNQTLSKDNLSQYFANSFLVEIRNSDNEYVTDKMEFIKLNSDRKEEFRTSTIIWSNDVVFKSPLSSKAKTHIKNMFNESKSVIGKIKCLPAGFEGDSIYYDLIKKQSYEDLVVEAIMDDDRDKFFELIDNYYDALFYDSIESNDYANDDFLKVFKKKSDISFHCHEKSNLDLIFSNIFIIDGNFVVIDYEWIFDFKIPLEYIFFRVINHHFKTNKLIRDFTTMEEVFNHVNLDVNNGKLFETWESNFLRFVFDHPPFPKSDIISINNINLSKYDEYMDLKYNLDDMNPNKIESLKRDIVVNQRKIINLKNNELKEKNKEINRKNIELNKKEAEINRKNKELKSLLNSSSWRITKPLRKLKSLIKR